MRIRRSRIGRAADGLETAYNALAIGVLMLLIVLAGLYGLVRLVF